MYKVPLLWSPKNNVIINNTLYMCVCVCVCACVCVCVCVCVRVCVCVCAWRVSELEIGVGHFLTNFRIWQNKSEMLGQIYCQFLLLITGQPNFVILFSSTVCIYEASVKLTRVVVDMNKYTHFMCCHDDK